jgi:GNAT superfamily N-acetyltransferase
MADPILTLTDTWDSAARDAIEQGLAEYNAAQAGYRDWRGLAVLVQDPETGRTIGGILGRTSLGLLFIDLVFLPEELRGGGIGARMLAMAETEAARRGCRFATLVTITFQAPAFYQRHGWEEFGRVPCDPPGTARVFFRKELAQAG